MKSELRQYRHFRRVPLSELDDTYISQITTGSLHAGFPSPAADYEQHRINLTKELVPNPEYTELIQCFGDCCIDRHITDGCLVLVDYSVIPPEHNSLVYARHFGDERDMIRVFSIEKGKVLLRTANKAKDGQPGYEPIRPAEREDVEIRGVVIQILIDPQPFQRRRLGS